ncbi:MAG: type II toxin-antitoxin system death-on-curing family toxin [Flammeovirgaceae bacterium]|nr:type II toxin-antitoxin system death-on-curing family toxin [Flammeovirgaceae bacterium]
MMELEDIIKIHQYLVKEFGGHNGIRDKELLSSAILRPFMTFGGMELYKTPEERASAYLESILVNHPFVDGNKRTGYTLMRLMLLNNGKDLKATKKERYEMIMKVASGEYDYDHILNWLFRHTTKRK